MKRSAAFLLLAVSTASVTWLACVGDDPVTSTSSIVDAAVAPDTGTGASDGATETGADAGPTAECDPTKPFGPKTPISGIFQGGAVARLSQDELDITTRTSRACSPTEARRTSSSRSARSEATRSGRDGHAATPRNDRRQPGRRSQALVREVALLRVEGALRGDDTGERSDGEPRRPALTRLRPQLDEGDAILSRRPTRLREDDVPGHDVDGLHVLAVRRRAQHGSGVQHDGNERPLPDALTYDARRPSRPIMQPARGW